jgi:hypothetical protein
VTHLLIALLLAAEPDGGMLLTTSEVMRPDLLPDAGIYDAPRVIELTPTAHEARVELRTCEKNLADCKAEDRISTKWLWVGIAVAVVAGAGIGFGFGVGYALKR